jgi:hypothetical protein
LTTILVGGQQKDMKMFTLSIFNVVLFTTLVFGVAGLTLLVVRKAGHVNNEPLSTSRRSMVLTSTGLVIWLGVPFILAQKGVLADFSNMPSPFMKLLFTFTFMTVMLSAVSPLGKRLAMGLSLHTLFGFQAFRIVIELLLILLNKQGLAPIQMTLEGRNWDLVTGLLALGVLVFFRNKSLSKSTYTVLNLIGLGLAINVVVVGFLSLPTPFQAFAGDNTWITTAPFVWLPTFLVELAIAGHILSLRKLVMGQQPRQCPILAAAD